MRYIAWVTTQGNGPSKYRGVILCVYMLVCVLSVLMNIYSAVISTGLKGIDDSHIQACIQAYTHKRVKKEKKSANKNIHVDR